MVSLLCCYVTCLNLSDGAGREHFLEMDTIQRVLSLQQVGFVVALLAEFNVPAEGLFGAWDGHALSVFGASASFLIACAAVRSPTVSHISDSLFCCTCKC